MDLFKKYRHKATKEIVEARILPEEIHGQKGSIIWSLHYRVKSHVIFGSSDDGLRERVTKFMDEKDFLNQYELC